MLTVVQIVIYNGGKNSDMHIKFYQSEEGRFKKGQITEKDVQRFLCLVISILKFERELN